MILHLGPIHWRFKTGAKNLSVKHLHFGAVATVQRGSPSFLMIIKLLIFKSKISICKCLKCLLLVKNLHVGDVATVQTGSPSFLIYDEDFDFIYLIFTVSYILNNLDEGDSSLKVGCLLKISILSKSSFHNQNLLCWRL